MYIYAHCSALVLLQPPLFPFFLYPNFNFSFNSIPFLHSILNSFPLLSSNSTFIMSNPTTVSVLTFLFLLCSSFESSMQQTRHHHHHSHHSHGHQHHRIRSSSSTTRPVTKRRNHTPGLPKESTTVIVNQTQKSEEQFMRWVKFVGSLRHSVFKTAKNMIFPSYTLTVSKNPLLGDFTSIQDAVDSLPPINLVRVVIRVMAGTYTEKVYIPPFKSFVTVEGDGADSTIVQWGDTALTIGPDGRKLGTFGSATFAVNSPFFIAKNITFQNTNPVPAPGTNGEQAVAFRISADTAAFLGCRFLGAQDTLYDHLGRHYYKDCYIEGTVDFIFGNGLSFFEECHVHAIAPRFGALTAQGRKSMLDDTGFAFVNCKVTGSGAMYLGRAWGPFSRVVFAYTYLDDIIIPKGWYNWGDPNREMTVFYGQYKCTGQGSNFAGRVAWSRELTDEEAKPFLSLSYIDGAEWLML